MSTTARVGWPKIRSKATLVVRIVPSSSRMVITSGEAAITVERHALAGGHPFEGDGSAR